VISSRRAFPACHRYLSLPCGTRFVLRTFTAGQLPPALRDGSAPVIDSTLKSASSYWWTTGGDILYIAVIIFKRRKTHRRYLTTAPHAHHARTRYTAAPMPCYRGKSVAYYYLVPAGRQGVGGKEKENWELYH